MAIIFAGVLIIKGSPCPFIFSILAFRCDVYVCCAYCHVCVVVLWKSGSLLLHIECGNMGDVVAVQPVHTLFCARSNSNSIHTSLTILHDSCPRTNFAQTRCPRLLALKSTYVRLHAVELRPLKQQRLYN